MGSNVGVGARCVSAQRGSGLRRRVFGQLRFGTIRTQGLDSRLGRTAALRVRGSCQRIAVRRLTRFESNAKRGDVSPAGQLVVFDGGPASGRRPSDFDVQLINPDGSRRGTLVGSAAKKIDARFSPDGRWISYSRESPTRDSSIWIVRTDGRDRRRGTDGSSARWSPDGRYLLFARDERGQTELYRTALAGAEIQRLTNTPASEDPAAWSPDGKQVLFSLLLAAGCDPAYVMAQVGHTDPTVTLRIYQQLLKPRRREEYRESVNELLGTSPAATSSGHLAPNLDPNSVLDPHEHV